METINNLIQRLNELTNSGNRPYILSRAYGGCQLLQRVNDDGAVRTVSCDGYGTKKQLESFLRSYIEGYVAGQKA